MDIEQLREKINSSVNQDAEIKFPRLDKDHAEQFLHTFPLFVHEGISLNKFVSDMIHEEYNAFTSPSMSHLVDNDSKILLLKKLKLIDDTLMFKDCESKVLPSAATDTNNNSEVAPFINKLLIALDSKIEKAFKIESINEDFVNFVKNLPEYQFLPQDFKDGLESDKILRYESINDLVGGLLDEPNKVFAMVLKTYISGIAYDYYLVWKYYWLYFSSNVDTTTEEKTLLMEILYEGNIHILNQTTRVFPKIPDIAYTTKGYYLTHFLVGPQYFLFKTIMKALRSY